MTSPAACGYSPQGCLFWFAHETKSLDLPTIMSDAIEKDGTNTERAHRLALCVRSWIRSPRILNPGTILIEDYAYNARGRVFHIGENTGILKFLLEQECMPYDVVPPTVIKKFATGRGNADKKMMTKAFLEAYPDATSWIPELFPRTKEPVPANSPLADLADAYWIARYNYERLANSIP